MNKLKLLVAILGVALVASCSKNKTIAPNTVDNSAVNVYVAGADGNIAKLWKNDVPVAYSDGKQPAGLSSVFVSGTDVYAGGFDGKIARVWKNGIPTSITDGKFSAIVNSIFVSG